MIMLPDIQKVKDRRFLIMTMYTKITFFFFLNDPPPTKIYPLPLPAPFPISPPGDPLREAVPCAVVSRQCEYRPVAAVQQSFLTEALDHARGIREEILRAPRFRRFGEQSRQLAAHVLVGRETRDVLAPRLERADRKSVV